MDALKERLSNIEIDSIMNDMIKNLTPEQMGYVKASADPDANDDEDYGVNQDEDEPIVNCYYVNKLLYVADLLDESPCKEEFNRLVKRFGYFHQLTQADINVMVDEGETVWLEWLKDHEFIEYKKPEKEKQYKLVAFTEGQKYCDTDGEICRIVIVDAETGNKVDGGNVLSIKKFNGDLVVYRYGHVEKHNTYSSVRV